ncbi:MAG: hypothetical protein NVSMB7_06070 [Chitinophagaceae bacterium]
MPKITKPALQIALSFLSRGSGGVNTEQKAGAESAPEYSND